MTYPVISKELGLLIKALNLVFNKKKTELTFKKDLKIDWQKAIYLAEFHNFKPILYHFLNENKIDGTKFKELQKYSLELAVNNLFSSAEFVHISKLLNGKNQNYLPYKGHLFLEKLFSGKQLRAIGDLDLLVLPQNAKETLRILVEYGYNFHDAKTGVFTNEQLIEIVPVTFGMNETTLVKNLNGKNLFIDFHWGFHYSFLPYQIDLEALFENKSTVNINGIECTSPSDFANFIMLTIHHAGRECWISLKYIADLMGFMENLGDQIDWKEMLFELEKMKLKRPALVGFFLLQEYFDYELPEIIKQSFDKNDINLKLTEPIIDYWENCYDILSLKGRLKYERILWSIQDEGFSRWKYLKEMFKMYSIPNPIESPRLVTFPEKYYFLNAASKVVTYLYKRGFGKVIR